MPADRPRHARPRHRRPGRAAGPAAAFGSRSCSSSASRSPRPWLATTVLLRDVRAHYRRAAAGRARARAPACARAAVRDPPRPVALDAAARRSPDDLGYARARRAKPARRVLAPRRHDHAHREGRRPGRPAAPGAGRPAARAACRRRFGPDGKPIPTQAVSRIEVDGGGSPDRVELDQAAADDAHHDEPREAPPGLADAHPEAHGPGRARHRRPALLRSPRHRPHPHRRRDHHEHQGRPALPRRREHAHAAAREELLPDAGEVVPAQAPGAVPLGGARDAAPPRTISSSST